MNGFNSISGIIIIWFKLLITSTAGIKNIVLYLLSLYENISSFIPGESGEKKFKLCTEV